MTNEGSQPPNHAPESAGHVRGILGYFFVLYVTTTIAGGGFMGIPREFLLKDRLKLDPTGISAFHFWLSVPLFVGFVFGFIRDRWSPLGLRDRGYLLLFGPLAGIAFLYLAFGELTYGRLVAVYLLIVICFRFIGAAISGLTAVIGQQDWLSGRLSTLSNTIGYLLGAVLTLAGGWIGERLPFQVLLVAGAFLTLGLAAISLWKPKEVFNRTWPANRRRAGWSEVKRLARHWAIWPPIVIWLLWQFTPAGFTPLLFFLTDHLKESEAQFALFNAVSGAFFVPTMLLYGWACKRYSMRKILLWSTILAIPQWIIVVFIRTPNEGLVIAAGIGLLGGAATAAYYDLIIRSCPQGLEGAAMLLADAGLAIGIRFGDLWGSRLYKIGGYDLTAWVTTAAYVLILPLLMLIPKAVTAHKDVVVAV